MNPQFRDLTLKKRSLPSLPRFLVVCDDQDVFQTEGFLGVCRLVGIASISIADRARKPGASFTIKRGGHKYHVRRLKPRQEEGVF